MEWKYLYFRNIFMVFLSNIDCRIEEKLQIEEFVKVVVFWLINCKDVIKEKL